MSREYILNTVRKNKPSFVPLPELTEFEDTELDVVEAYVNVARSSGIDIIELDKPWESTEAKKYFPNQKNIVDLTATTSPYTGDIYEIDTLIINGQVGVAENAAIWVDESDIHQRILPFIAQELVVVLSKSDIVANMHQAYDRIDIAKTGYGVFIAGPSKTADIEQSLVIGAQAARKMYVLLH